MLCAVQPYGISFRFCCDCVVFILLKCLSCPLKHCQSYSRDLLVGQENIPVNHYSCQSHASRTQQHTSCKDNLLPEGAVCCCCHVSKLQRWKFQFPRGVEMSTKEVVKVRSLISLTDCFCQVWMINPATESQGTPCSIFTFIYPYVLLTNLVGSSY